MISKYTFRIRPLSNLQFLLSASETHLLNLHWQVQNHRNESQAKRYNPLMRIRCYLITLRQTMFFLGITT